MNPEYITMYFIKQNELNATFLFYYTGNIYNDVGDG